MRVGILGSGLMGGTLGIIIARAGHEVVFTFSLLMGEHAYEGDTGPEIAYRFERFGK